MIINDEYVDVGSDKAIATSALPFPGGSIPHFWIQT